MTFRQYIGGPAMLQRTFRFHAVGLVVVFTLIHATNAEPSAYMLSVNNYGSTTLHEISIYAGHAFTVYINLNVPGQIFTAGARLHSSASNVFDVTGGLYFSPWTLPFGSIAPGG